jgi:hypothetical protein
VLKLLETVFVLFWIGVMFILMTPPGWIGLILLFILLRS